MQYLQRKNKPSSKAHIWNQQKKDTACRMWSTGGLGKDNNYEIIDSTDKSICTMCSNNYEPVKEESLKYQHLFDLLKQEHGITPTIGEMDDIIYEVKKMF